MLDHYFKDKFRHSLKFMELIVKTFDESFTSIFF